MTNPVGTLFVADERERSRFGVPFLRMNDAPMPLQRILVSCPFDLAAVGLDEDRSNHGIIHVVKRGSPVATVAVFVPNGVDRHVAEHELRNEYGGTTRLWDVPIGAPIVT